MSLQFRFDKPTAVKIAQLLEGDGMPKAAADIWLGLCAHDPYDWDARKRFGDLYFDLQQPAYPQGTVERSRFILLVIGNGFPTDKLRAAYFDNLRQVLGARTKRPQPGAVAIGLGTGRCGSTTLSAAFESLPDSCSTHENPPPISWEKPLEEQLRFHFDRFSMLREYYAVVFDASHWWLNSLERVFAEFPNAKAIGLYRQTQACVRSYMSIKGRGPGSTNHWVPPANGIWNTSPGDPSYPTYPVPSNAAGEPDAAKAAVIERYVIEYNQALQALAARLPERLLLLRTEDLNAAETAARLTDLLGMPIVIPQALNVGGTADSNRLNQKL
jgi:hypothetical protein